MNEKVLVAFATRTGTTQEMCEAIGEVFAKNGATVDVW